MGNNEDLRNTLKNTQQWNRVHNYQQQHPPFHQYQDNGYYNQQQHRAPNNDNNWQPPPYRFQGRGRGSMRMANRPPAQQQQRNFNPHVRSNRFQSQEEPNMQSSFGSVEFERPSARPSMSVRVSNEDHFQRDNYDSPEMYSRRTHIYAGVAPSSSPYRNPIDDSGQATVFDYHHSRSRLPGPQSNTGRPIGSNYRDPRIVRLVNQEVKVVKREPLVCELPSGGGNTNPLCAHPRAAVAIKKEPNATQGPPSSSTAANPLSLLKPPATTHLDRIEREKYEKAKHCRNTMRGERAVDSIRPVPRPARDPELDAEISIEIEKNNVPVITTSADFSKYKIPRAPKETPAASSTPATATEPTAVAPASVNSVKEKSPPVSDNKEKEQTAPASDNNKKEKPVTSELKSGTKQVPSKDCNKPKDKAVDKIKTIDKACETVASLKLITKEVSVRITPIDCSKISSCDSPSSSVSRRDDSCDSSSSEIIRNEKGRRKKRVIQSSESEADDVPLKQRIHVKDNAAKQINREQAKNTRRSRDQQPPVSTDKRRRPSDSERKGRYSENVARKSSNESSSGNKDSPRHRRRSRSKTRDSGSRKPALISSEESDNGHHSKRHSLPSIQPKSAPASASPVKRKSSCESSDEPLVKKSKEKPRHKSRSRTDSSDDRKESRRKRKRSKSTVTDESASESNSLECQSSAPAKTPAQINSSESDTNHQETTERDVLASPQPSLPIIPSSVEAVSNILRQVNIDPEIRKQIENLLLAGSTPRPIHDYEPPARASSSNTQMQPPMQRPICIPLTIDLPKAQSPTISSCHRMDDCAPSPQTPTVMAADPIPGEAVASVQPDEQPTSSSPKAAKRVRRSKSCCQPSVAFETTETDTPALKRTRKSELEKLHEGIHDNYELNYIMSGRAAKAPVKDAPKKIARRRQSMCSSLSTENGGIKLTITIDKSKQMKRRLSVDCLRAPPVRIEDDIRNDDPFYDLDSGNCRLCTKSSSNMAAHYMQYHRDAEVFCSRINYNCALRLKRGEPCDVKVNVNTSEYDCLLCEKTQTCTTYYEIYKHFASHTGEYYHKCTQCEFRDVTLDNTHSKLHKFEIFPFPPIENNKLVAFMCDKCHYVQLQKANVQKHIVCHHRDETVKVSFKEIILLDFDNLKIVTLDFEDLDGRFKVMPVIETRDDTWMGLEDTYNDYMSAEQTSENEADEEEGPERSFEVDVKRLMAVPASKSHLYHRKISEIRIDNLTYNTKANAYEYVNGSSVVPFTNAEKLRQFLEETENKWSGMCNECDEKTAYSEEDVAIAELDHLNWHLSFTRHVERTSAVVNASNSLRPWLSKPVLKTLAECQEMLSIPAILSTYKCMSASCSFYTHSMAEMEKHLDQHDADLSTDDNTLTECCYCDQEFASPADYFAHILSYHSTSQYYCPYCFYRSNYTNTLHHVTVYHSHRNAFVLDGQFDGIYNEQPLDPDRLCELIETSVKSLSCRECDKQFFLLDKYQEHLKQHGEQFMCEICCESVPVSEFFPHSASHEQGPYHCSYCSFGALDGRKIKRHLIDCHCNEVPYVCTRLFRGVEDVNKLISIGLVAIGNGPIDEKAVKIIPKYMFPKVGNRDQGLTISNVQAGIEATSIPSKPSTPSTHNRKLSPFILNLPDNYIFDRAIKCPQCQYSTAIRTNLIRHFSLHESNTNFDQENDPVNRVPAIHTSPKVPRGLLTDSNNLPKMIPAKPIKRRRMTVSELSSGNVERPQYVPILQRFRCGVDKCTYFAPEERILKAHIIGIHNGDVEFKCPHCKHSTYDLDSDVIMGHYKLHDSQLYTCALCTDFYADTKNNVSKHIRKRHKATVNDEDIKVIRETGEVRTSPAAKPSKTQLMRRNSVAAKRPRLDMYACSYCSFEGISSAEMLSHIKAAHGLESQYQCSACKRNLNAEKGFKTHVTTKHPRSRPDMITHFKSTNEPARSFSPPAKQLSAQVEALVPVPRAAPNGSSDLFTSILDEYNKHPAHRRPVFYCDKCPQTFDDLTEISEHYKESHDSIFNPQIPGDLVYSCLFCDFYTPRSATLASHFTKAHEGLMPLYQLEYTVRCVRCDFYNTAEKIRDHYKELHPTDQRPLMRSMSQSQFCGLCVFPYRNESQLDDHFQRAHKKICNQRVMLLDPSLIKNLLNLKVEKQFKCKQCNVVLNNNQIRFHKHTPLMPVEMAHRFRCKLCSFLTLDYEAAKMHVNEHKKKSINCERCDAKISNYDGLIMHISKHYNAADYMETVMQQYSLEIIFPNGLVASESVKVTAQDNIHFNELLRMGREV